MTDRDDTEFESQHGSSQLHHVLTELQLYGYRPFTDEPDPRPLPEAKSIAGAVADIFDAFVATHADIIEMGPASLFGARGQGDGVYVRDPDGHRVEVRTY